MLNSFPVFDPNVTVTFVSFSSTDKSTIHPSLKAATNPLYLPLVFIAFALAVAVLSFDTNLASDTKSPNVVVSYAISLPSSFEAIEK